MRHGLTVAEILKLFNEVYGIGCDLEIIPMKGWRRAMYFRDTGLPWIAPSPNLPTPESAMVYPGQVLWEGTNVSEGRGTTQPFEIFGAPFLDTEKILSMLGGNRIPGAVLRPLGFEPTSNNGKAFCAGDFRSMSRTRISTGPTSPRSYCLGSFVFFTAGNLNGNRRLMNMNLRNCLLI